MARLSRSLKVIGTDGDRSATYDFLLVFCSNVGLFHTVYEIKGNIVKILTPLVFNASSPEGVHIGDL